MTLRTDIRAVYAKKECNGASCAANNRYDRAIFHTGHQEFVICAGNGLVYTLDGLKNKVQQTPGVPGAGLPDLVVMVQDFRSNQTIVSNQIQIAVDDGNLDNWVVSTASTQNTNCLFTLPGNGLVFKLEEDISFSNDNYVSDQTLGVTIFAFPGAQTYAQTANGRIVCAAGPGEIGFITAGQDPNVALNWGVIVNQPTVAPFTQMAINDAGTFVVMGAQRGDVVTWVPGAATTTLIPAVDNSMINTPIDAGHPNIASVVYSSFWDGFILMNAAGSQLGFVPDGQNVVQGALILGFGTDGIQANPRNSPVSAANPAGEIIICSGGGGAFGVHEMYMISPP